GGRVGDRSRSGLVTGSPAPGEWRPLRRSRRAPARVCSQGGSPQGRRRGATGRARCEALRQGSPGRPFAEVVDRTCFVPDRRAEDRKSTRLNSNHVSISYAVFCLKKKKREHKL